MIHVDNALWLLMEKDPTLNPWAGEIRMHLDRFNDTRWHLAGEGSLSDFANGHRYFGFHRTETGWVFREWLPGADAAWLTGDFNFWAKWEYPLQHIGNGVWEIHLDGWDALKHGQFVKLLVGRQGTSFERIPAYMTRCVMDMASETLCGQIWMPDTPFEWTDWDFYGNAPDGRLGLSAINNLLYVHALQSAAKAEDAVGERDMADCCRSRANAVAAAIRARFWDASRGLVADTVAKDCFSEHAQCLALLADILPSGDRERAFKGLVEVSGLARCTVYFSHYLFETYLKFGRADLFLKKLDLWRGFVSDGLKTPLEAPGARGRSDCHAWGAHPLYHLLTGVAGIRPLTDGFAAVEVAPQFGPLTCIQASLPTPKGTLSVDLRRDGDSLSGMVDVPPGLPAEFVWQGRCRKLHDGINDINDE